MILVHTQIAFKLSGSGVVKGSSPLPLESSNPNEDVGSHGVKNPDPGVLRTSSGQDTKPEILLEIQSKSIPSKSLSAAWEANFSGMKGK